MTLTPEREREIRRWADHPTNAVLLAEIDRLRADLADLDWVSDKLHEREQELAQVKRDLATAREALEAYSRSPVPGMARQALDRIGGHDE